ncbi:MAG: hypothetical protein JW776_09405 [Candidatus Lokiarchaeota archaeon]|nr:hypothetical protein [Candidatus Lokiarchaeota archaeon]
MSGKNTFSRFNLIGILSLASCIIGIVFFILFDRGIMFEFENSHVFYLLFIICTPFLRLLSFILGIIGLVVGKKKDLENFSSIPGLIFLPGLIIYIIYALSNFSMTL